MPQQGPGAYEKWKARVAPDTSAYAKWQARVGSPAPQPTQTYAPHLNDPHTPPESPSQGFVGSGWFSERFPKLTQGVYGVTDATLRTAEGLSRNAGNVLPGRDPFQRFADWTREKREGFQERTAPETTGEMLARIAGNIGGEGAQYAIGGAGIRKTAGPIVREVGERVAPRVVAKLAGPGLRNEVLKDALAVAPVDMAVTAVGPENSTLGAISDLTQQRYPGVSKVTGALAKNPVSRFVSEVLIGGAADAALRGTARGIKDVVAPGGIVADAMNARPLTEAAPDVRPVDAVSEVDRFRGRRLRGPEPEAVDHVVLERPELSGKLREPDVPPPPPPDLLAPRRSPEEQSIDAFAARDMHEGGPFADLGDDDLLARWAQYQRGLGRAETDATDATLSNVRRDFNTWGDPVVGLDSSPKGQYGRFARGRQTQAKQRIAEIEKEIQRRGLSTTDVDPYLDAGQTDVLEPNKDLVGRSGENLRSLDDQALLNEIEASKQAFYDNRGNAASAERMALLYAEAQRQGRNVDLDSAFGAVLPEVNAALARTGLGAVGGAALDREEPLRGAVVGGLAAAGAPAAYRGLRGMGQAGAAVNPRRLAGQVDTGLPGLWYSRLQRAIEGGPGKATGEQWLGFLNPAKRGFAEGEAEWSGIRSWLTENADTKLSKDEVLGRVRERGVRLEESVKGTNLPSIAQGRTTEQLLAESDRLTRLAQQYQARGDRASANRYFDEAEQFTRYAEERDLGGESVRFEQYTQPGGENYREVLVKLDTSPTAKDTEGYTAKRPEWSDDPQAWEIVGPDGVGVGSGRGASPDEAVAAWARTSADVRGSAFTSSHWPDDPNTLAHVRLTDRTINGEKTLFVEEIQSDWHQKGRERGYGVTNYGPDDATVEDWSPSAWRITFPGRDYIGISKRLFPTEAEAVSEAVRQINFSGGPGVPDAPYKSTDEWTGLAVRRVLQEAVEGGYDRIAWASGEQSANLYDLRKQVSRIEYDGERLRAYDHTNAEVVDEVVPPSDLPDYVGKDGARKLMEQDAPAYRVVDPEDTQPDGISEVVWGEGATKEEALKDAESWVKTNASEEHWNEIADRLEVLPGKRVLEGDDLAVGGEGMLEYYDRIVPKVFQKEAKALGVKVDVEPVSIGMIGKPKDPDMIEMVDFLRAEDMSDDEIVRHLSKVEGIPESEARELVFPTPEATTSPTNLSIRITPEAKAKIKSEGTRLYARGVGPIAGAGIGATQGETAEERGANAATGFLAGAALEFGGPALRRLKGNVALPTTAASDVEAAARAMDVTRPGGEGMAEFITKTPQQRLTDETQRMIEKVGKRTVTWDETRTVAQELGLDMADIDRKQASRLNGAEMLAIRNVVSTNLERVADLGAQLKDATLSGQARERIMDQIAFLDGENANLLSKFAKGRTAAGRNLNNLKILANHSMDKTVWLSKAQSVLGGPLSPEQRAAIVALADSNDRIGLVQFIRDIRPSTWADKVMTLRKAGLLTSPTTHFANIAGNTTMAALEAASNPAAVMWDSLIRTAYDTGVTSKSLGSRRQAQAAWDGAKAGLRDARKAMKGELTAEDLLKYDVRQTNFNTETRAGAFAQKYTDMIFRSLDAEDRVFRGVAFRRSLAEQAEALAKSASKDNWQGAADALFASPTDEMVIRALADAEYTTFRNRGSLAKVASGIRKVAREIGPEAEAVFDLVAPFTTTPANVATRVAEYSPLGFINAKLNARELRKAIEGGGDVFGAQKRVSEAAGRATVGSAAIALGMYLASKDLLTGEYPINDLRTRNNWELTGKIPQAILVNGEWRSVERVSPLGNLVALGGEMYRAVSKEGATAEELVGTLPAAVASTTLSMSFLQGIQQSLDAIKDPERSSARFVRSLAGSFVPTIAGRTARAVDPTMREAQTVGQTLRSKVPGLRNTLPARYNALGDERRTQGGIGEIIDPFASSKDKRVTDALIAEIDRVGANIPPYRPSSLNDEELGLEFARGEKEYADLAKMYGERVRYVLQKVVEASGYAGLPDDQKREVLEDAARRTKSMITRSIKGARR